MHVTFLVPDVHERPTGGNIYNKRIAAGLERHGSVEVVPWRPEASAAPDLDLPPDAALIVDSLLVRRETALRRLKAAHPTATFVLLAHYLHCIDPNQRGAPAAETERAILPLFDGVVTTSDYAKEALTEEGVATARIHVVPPGLNETYRAPAPNRAGRGTPRLLTVANLLPGKGLPALVQVLATLTDAAWSWTLVGDDTLDPSFAETLHAEIEDSSIADRTTRLGPIPPTDLRGQYDRADVFVLPSRFETCSMVTREAMARGLPVLATDVGGLPENFGGAVSRSHTPRSPVSNAAPPGHLVSPDRPEALAETLRALLADPATRKRIGTAARERSRVFPPWDEAARRFRAALRALVSVSDSDTG